MKRLCRVSSLPDAHILRDVLDQSGIEVMVFNEHAQSGAGQLPPGEACPELWVVQESDFERARAIVGEFESAPRVTGSRRCAACAEDSPSNFQVCWSCGAAL